MFNVVVAMDKQRGIGRDGRLPWKLAGDTRFFRQLTTCPDRAAVERRYGLSPGVPTTLPMPSPDRRNAVLMGRKTWDSLPASYKPLPNRLNGVLSRQGTNGGSGTHRVWGDLDQALADLARDQSVCETYVIGGAQIYAEAILSPDCGRLYLTEIESSFDCDAHFPKIPAVFSEVSVSETWEENGIRFRFRLLKHAFALQPPG